MNISLPPQLEKLVLDRVKSGRYGSASEVMRHALRLLEKYDQALDEGFTNLHADVQAGLRELDAGTSQPLDDAALERIKATGRAKLKAAKSAGG